MRRAPPRVETLLNRPGVGLGDDKRLGVTLLVLVGIGVGIAVQVSVGIGDGVTISVGSAVGVMLRVGVKVAAAILGAEGTEGDASDLCTALGDGNEFACAETPPVEHAASDRINTAE